MAKEIKSGSKRSDQDPKRRKSASEYRASHRIHSAASADRKRATGLVRLSVWVPLERSNDLKLYAKGLCEGRVPDDAGRAQAGHGKFTVIDFTPTRRTKKRASQPCDKRQLDLFDPT